MIPRTLNEIFLSTISRNSPQVMLDRKTGVWVPISAAELYRDVIAISAELRSWGIKPRDRIAILSENRPEWAMADFATLAIGAVVVPLYTTLTPEQSAYILQDSGARVIFVSNEQQLQKIQHIQSQTALEKIVVMDPVETAHAIHMYRMMQSSTTEQGPQIEEILRGVTPDDLATIIYTSGTTGIPKGVMLTHGNMASNLNCSLGGFQINDTDVMISFLPLSHVTARHVDYVMLHHGVTLAYVPSVELLPQALREIKPTVFVGVPRVYEKVHAQVDIKAQGFPKRWIYRWALRTGRHHREEVLNASTPTSLKWKVAHRLVYGKLQEGMGGRARLFISGGAPLGRELSEWYADMGIRILEGYGLTETAPVVAVNNPIAHKLGTVGKPLSNVEVLIAEDGEVLVRAPSVFKGYWNKPEETAKAFDNGWFKTGDIGEIDVDGFLSITDRKKDLIKTSGGKFIAPQPIENSLKHNALIAEAIVLGDKHKFPAVLVVPFFSLLEEWARKNQIPFSSRQELVQQEKVRLLYEGIVDDLNKNLARFERLKRVLLVAEELSAESGTLTASMKMRRRAVADRYRELIERMYAEAETVSVTHSD